MELLESFGEGFDLRDRFLREDRFSIAEVIDNEAFQILDGSNGRLSEIVLEIADSLPD